MCFDFFKRKSTKNRKAERKMNKFEVRYGNEIDRSILEQVYALDVMCYEKELQGELENLIKRYECNRDTFICVMDGERLAGYINFFPIGEKLHEDLFDDDHREIRDDDIEPEEMAQYTKDGVNNIFIISVVVHPDYRDGETVKLIGRKFAKFIADKQADGYNIGDITGTAVSGGGRKFLSRMGFEPRRELEEGYVLYVCDGENLEELIEDGRE